MIHTHRLELFACRASEDFARQVIDHINLLQSPEEPELSEEPEDFEQAVMPSTMAAIRKKASNFLFIASPPLFQIS